MCDELGRATKCVMHMRTSLCCPIGCVSLHYRESSKFSVFGATISSVASAAGMSMLSFLSRNPSNNKRIAQLQLEAESLSCSKKAKKQIAQKKLSAQAVIYDFLSFIHDCQFVCLIPTIHHSL